jgi:hypothetical protein
MRTSIILCCILAMGAALVSFTQPLKAADDCAPSGKLNFVCGPSKSEDMVLVPGTHWIIASGANQLYLINADSKAWRELYPGQEPQERKDTAMFGDCPGGAPDPKKYAAVGLYIRASEKGVSRLYTVSRSTRNAIEVFEVDSRGAEPSVTWVGCAVWPKGANGNAVAALPDGGILMTVPVSEGHTLEESRSGQISGAVWEWHPKTGFQSIPGTELSGNNGIEVTPDGKQFFVNATGGRSVTRFTRTGGALKTDTVALDVGPDNIRWGQDGRLYIGGRADEPACGGTLAPHNGKIDTDCPRGFMVVALDPKTLKTQVIWLNKPDPVFNGWSTALQIDNVIWMPGLRADRAAYFTFR